MPYVKQIVCLANSYKTNGRCIAGREVSSNGYGGWIRPVSNRPTTEVSLTECRYPDYAIPKLLDVVNVPLLSPAPHAHQTENYLIDAARPWSKASQIAWSALAQIEDRPERLWITRDSTTKGTFDCLSPEAAATQHSSLALIRPRDFVVAVGSRTWEGTTKKTWRGNFNYNGTYYSLGLTDPAARNAFSDRDEGEYPLKEPYLCVSLTEPYQEDGRCHKLVAGVISNPPL